MIYKTLQTHPRSCRVRNHQREWQRSRLRDADRWERAGPARQRGDEHEQTHLAEWRPDRRRAITVSRQADATGTRMYHITTTATYVRFAVNQRTAVLCGKGRQQAETECRFVNGRRDATSTPSDGCWLPG